MGINSQEVSYGFGQMGSIHVIGENAIVPSSAAVSDTKPNKAVFVAITFLEDTKFHNSADGLIPEIAQLYPSSVGTGADIDDSDGAAVGTEIFPKGMTIYGRWTGFKLAEGRVIAYIGY